MVVVIFFFWNFWEKLIENHFIDYFIQKNLKNILIINQEKLLKILNLNWY